MSDLDLRNQRVLIREDLNVPIDEQGRITSTQRLDAALPTIVEDTAPRALRLPPAPTATRHANGTTGIADVRVIAAPGSRASAGLAALLAGVDAAASGVTARFAIAGATVTVVAPGHADPGQPRPDDDARRGDGVHGVTLRGRDPSPRWRTVAGALLAPQAAFAETKLNALFMAQAAYSEADVRAMAAAGTVAVLLPGAFHVLRETRLPPVDLLRRHGVPIAISSDMNPGTSPVLSLRLMLSMACTLFRLTPEEALAGATIHAARALGLQASHGVLAAGRVADFVAWDVAHPAELAYWIGGDLPKRVIRHGQQVCATTLA